MIQGKRRWVLTVIVLAILFSSTQTDAGRDMMKIKSTSELSVTTLKFSLKSVEEARTAGSDDQPSQPVQPSEPVGKPDQSLN